MVGVDPFSVVEIIRAVVRTEIVPRFCHLTPHQILTKSSAFDLVTEADLEAELSLKHKLEKLLPGSVTIGEEGVYKNPNLLDRLQENGCFWVIDPVDGTGNFVRKNKRFATIVALVINGITEMGFINDCMNEKTYVAIRNRGCFCVKGEAVKDHYKTLPRLADFSLLMKAQVGGKPLADIMKNKVNSLQRVTSTAHTYIDLLTGKIDIVAFTRLNVWDHAAGVLMVNELGGKVALVDKTPYSPGLNTGSLLGASTEGLWNTMRIVLMRPS